MQQQYGLLGYPLTHSFSRGFFNDKFQAESIEATYLNFEIPAIDELPEVLAHHPQLCGLNVTRPYKEVVMHYLQQIDEAAQRVGAVNVIKFNRNGKKLTLTGYNTDVIGFSESLHPLLQSHHTRALVLGTGGASKAVCVALEDLGIAYTLVSRTTAADRLAYSDLTPEVMQRYTVIVNTTPLGTYPHTDEQPPLPYEFITPEHLCYDLIYNPEETQFLVRAKAQGAVTKNGLEMLLLQALAAWRIWQE